MAHLLHVSIEKNLRRIFVVLPYTNIIDQNVEKLRDALTLPGENPHDVVVAHHHRALSETQKAANKYKEKNEDEDNVDLRHFAFQWQAPIIVTTAVQFFETLSVNKTSILRKLHQVPNSAIMIDEAHAAIPIYLWRQHWLWLQELIRNWNCHWVLASGSLCKFWESHHIVECDKQTFVKAPSLVTDKALDGRLKQFNNQRLSIRSYSKIDPKPFAPEALCDWIQVQPGPRLVVFNTVFAAAKIADMLRNKIQENKMDINRKKKPNNAYCIYQQRSVLSTVPGSLNKSNKT